MTNLLYSQDKQQPVKWFDRFDKELIKEAIKEHLKDNPDDTVEHCKQYIKTNVNKYYGYNIISFYQNNKKGEACKVILKGNKEYLKVLN